MSLSRAAALTLVVAVVDERGQVLCRSSPFGEDEVGYQRMSAAYPLVHRGVAERVPAVYQAALLPFGEGVQAGSKSACRPTGETLAAGSKGWGRLCFTVRT